MNTPPEVTLRRSYVITSVAGVAFFAISIVLLGILPARVLESQTAAMSPEHPLALRPSEERGRVVYSREGCAYCHSQQVRYLHSDMNRFGAPTLAWETRYDYPHLWGTRRIGPDLAREGGSHTSDWQYAHLYAPRAVVPQSVMPSYPWLFEGSPDKPNLDARNLIAYLDSLGHAREIAAPEGEIHAKDACQCANDEMAMMAFHSKELNANPAKTRRSTQAPELPASNNIARGRVLYAESCSGCHGIGGEGDGAAAKALQPPPGNLAEHRYKLQRLSIALQNGVDATSMPAWRDWSIEDRAAVAAAVQELSKDSPVVTASVELGERVYKENCVQCHGTEGAGNGTSVSELRVVPPNFKQAQPTQRIAIQAIRNGIAGTKMGDWSGRLTEEEIVAVASYVRGFYK